jgi:hypothetical protein
MGGGWSLKLYRKEGDILQILCFPDEYVEKGDYLAVEDLKTGRMLLAQTIDIQFPSLPGLLEDLLRDEAREAHIFGDEFDPLQIESQINLLRDARLIIAKIRCSVENGEIRFNVSWIPSRVHSRIYRIDPQRLCSLLGLEGRRPLTLGSLGGECELKIDAGSLDGRLSIIVGRKGTGKSYLAKLLILGLVSYGAPCLILDVNGEYAGLGLNPDGTFNRYHRKIRILRPGGNFKVTLAYAGKPAIHNILVHVLSTPENSTREFFRIWGILEARGGLSLKALREAIETDGGLHENIREALISRLSFLERSGFFTDKEGESLKIESLFSEVEDGGALVLDLSGSSPLERRMVVEFMLGKLTELLRVWRLRAVFLFAEEAHLYLRETYWEDVITRMRHLGLFTTFITNQPDSLREEIYRQADNIFLFNFINEHDLNAIARVARIDGETVRTIAQSLQPYHCLLIGHAVRDLPLTIKVKKLEVKAMGETRTFFTEVEGEVKSMPPPKAALYS